MSIKKLNETLLNTSLDGNFKKVKELIEQGANNLNEALIYGYPCGKEPDAYETLEDICEEEIEIVNYLVKKGANPNLVLDLALTTKGHHNLAIMLIEAGRNSETLNIVSKYGKLPDVKYVIEKLGIDNTLDEAYKYSLMNKNKDVSKYLIQKGANSGKTEEKAMEKLNEALKKVIGIENTQTLMSLLKINNGI